MAETRYTVQLRGRGTITLPNAVRQRYRYGAGEVFALVDLEGVLVLAPKVPLVPKLAGEIERLREESALSLEALVRSVHEERHDEAGR